MATKRFVVIGLGNFGSSVAEALHSKGHEVIALDSDEETVDRIAPFVSRAAVGDGRQIKTLERAGVKGADAGVVSTGDDITASILATMALRDLGVREIYVKVISRDHARVMEKIGVTETIFPERESALRLGTRMSGRGILNYIRMGTALSIQEMAVPEAWMGKSLRELELPRRYRISVIAVHDMLKDEMTVVPNPDAPLKDSDTLLVAGKDDMVEQRTVEKRYEALVWGLPESDEGEINLPICVDWPNRPRKIVDYENGKPAQTFYTVLQRDAARNIARVDLRPITGRSHQLRVHLAEIGHPILGCPFYAHEQARAAADRLTLHARELHLTHPLSGEQLSFEAPTPF